MGSYCSLPSRHVTLRQAATDTFVGRFRLMVGDSLNAVRELPRGRGFFVSNWGSTPQGWSCQLKESPQEHPPLLAGLSKTNPLRFNSST